MDNRLSRETPSNHTAGTFLAIVMIASGLMMLINRMVGVDIFGYEFSVDDNVFGIMSRILLLVGGTVILLKRGKGNYFAIGVYSMTLGISRIIRSLPDLVSQNDTVYYLSVIMTVVGINLAVCGYNHLTVKTRNPLMMRYTAIAVLVTYAVVLLYFAYIGESPAQLFSYIPDTIWYIPLYIGLLIALYSKDVVNNIPLGRIRKLAAEIADESYHGDETIISEEDAAKIRTGLEGPVSWTSK